MKKLWCIILSGLIISGCAIGPGPIKEFISPSQALYDQANAYFKQKDYDRAINIYEKFIKDYPTHKLTPGAYLGIAWSGYLKADYNKALENLAQVRTQDKELKSWIDKLAQDCKQKIAGTKEAASSTLFNIPQFTREDKIKIEGTAPEGGKVAINGQAVKITGGLFSQEVALTEGENTISIDITDKDGKVETKVAKVTLDRTKPKIKVTSAEVDDFGYVQISGLTKKGASVLAEGESLAVDANGKFSGQIKLPSNKEIKFVAEDQAGNTAEELFSDREYPDRPTGLRRRSISGDSVYLEWNKNRETDIKGYNVYYSHPGEFADLKKNTEVIRDTTYTITGLRSGNTYTIYIRAVDKMGNESQPSWETLTVVMP